MDEQARHKKERVLLIHGTFAGEECTKAPVREEEATQAETLSRPETNQPPRKERWWHDGGDFWNTLADSLGEDFELEPYLWPKSPGRRSEWPHEPEYGPNSELVRRKSALELFDYLKELEASDDETGYHLVGHSHGGSVVWLALQNAERNGVKLRKLRSWTTVATPFFRFRANWYEWLNTLPVLVFAVLVVALGWSNAEPFSNWYAEAPKKHWHQPFSQLPASLLVVPIGLILLLLPSVRFFKWLGRRRALRKLNSSEIEAISEYRDRWLGIYSQEDEAINGLNGSLRVQWNIVPRTGPLYQLAAPLSDSFIRFQLKSRFQGSDLPGHSLLSVSRGLGPVSPVWRRMNTELEEAQLESVEDSASSILQELRKTLQDTAEAGKGEGVELEDLMRLPIWDAAIHNSYFKNPKLRTAIALHILKNTDVEAGRWTAISDDVVEKWYAESRPGKRVTGAAKPKSALNQKRNNADHLRIGLSYSAAFMIVVLAVVWIPYLIGLRPLLSQYDTGYQARTIISSGNATKDADYRSRAVAAFLRGESPRASLWARSVIAFRGDNEATRDYLTLEISDSDSGKEGDSNARTSDSAGGSGKTKAKMPERLRELLVEWNALQGNAGMVARLVQEAEPGRRSTLNAIVENAVSRRAAHLLEQSPATLLDEAKALQDVAGYPLETRIRPLLAAVVRDPGGAGATRFLKEFRAVVDANPAETKAICSIVAGMFSELFVKSNVRGALAKAHWGKFKKAIDWEPELEARVKKHAAECVRNSAANDDDPLRVLRPEERIDVEYAGILAKLGLPQTAIELAESTKAADAVRPWLAEALFVNGFVREALKVNKAKVRAFLVDTNVNDFSPATLNALVQLREFDFTSLEGHPDLLQSENVRLLRLVACLSAGEEDCRPRFSEVNWGSIEEPQVFMAITRLWRNSETKRPSFQQGLERSGERIMRRLRNNPHALRPSLVINPGLLALKSVIQNDPEPGLELSDLWGTRDDVSPTDPAAGKSRPAGNLKQQVTTVSQIKGLLTIEDPQLASEVIGDLQPDAGPDTPVQRLRDELLAQNATVLIRQALEELIRTEAIPGGDAMKRLRNHLARIRSSFELGRVLMDALSEFSNHHIARAELPGAIRKPIFEPGTGKVRAAPAVLTRSARFVFDLIPEDRDYRTAGQASELSTTRFHHALRVIQRFTAQQEHGVGHGISNAKREALGIVLNDFLEQSPLIISGLRQGDLDYLSAMRVYLSDFVRVGPSKKARDDCEGRDRDVVLEDSNCGLDGLLLRHAAIMLRAAEASNSDRETPLVLPVVNYAIGANPR
ncbi:MAG: hypothetical protein AAF441_08025 [Pseudomonadota bacterium]